MIKRAHLWKEKTIKADNEIILSATIESPEQKRKVLWYRVPAEYETLLTETSDPFVPAILFSAMRKPMDLCVHGQVSPSLLRNLEEFQAAWNCWRPAEYTKIDIKADIEQEQAKVSSPDEAIAAFSGGIDSCFTVWRHHTNNCSRVIQNIKAAVFVQGFDIPTDEKEMLNRASENLKKMLQSLGIQLITVATNFRELSDNWEDAHGAAIASCLMLLQAGYDTGLIASTEPYDSLVLPWGSNPVSDRLLSSDTFRIVHDGAAFRRSSKVRQIANWPEALRYLRVCWQGKQKDRNCGRCEKCIRTILNFRAVGLSTPECFEQDIDNNQISDLKGLNAVQTAYLVEILSAARAASISGSWVAALEKCIKQNQSSTNSRQKIRKTLNLRRYLHRAMPNSGKFIRQWKLTGVKTNK